MKTKKEKIAEYIQKGVEWCANKYYIADERNKKANKELVRLRSQVGTRNEFYAIKKANENMQKVLEEYGVRPVHLTIKYKERNCEMCQYHDEVCDEGTSWDCYYTSKNDECPMTGGVASVGFWTYSVNDHDGFNGISSIFETKNYDAVKVTNDATGDVIYEYGEFENDEDDDE